MLEGGYVSVALQDLFVRVDRSGAINSKHQLKIYVET